MVLINGIKCIRLHTNVIISRVHCTWIWVRKVFQFGLERLFSVYFLHWSCVAFVLIHVLLVKLRALLGANLTVLVGIWSNVSWKFGKICHMSHAIQWNQHNEMFWMCICLTMRLNFRISKWSTCWNIFIVSFTQNSHFNLTGNLLFRQLLHICMVFDTYSSMIIYQYQWIWSAI